MSRSKMTLEEYVKAVVDQAPPLSEEQRVRIRSLLRTANDDRPQPQQPQPHQSPPRSTVEEMLSRE